MKIVTTFCCAALALCSAIYAQSTSDHITVHFNSPVMVGETKLPAGNCDIQVMHGNSNNIIVVLRPQGGPATAAVASRLSDGSQDEESSSVVLNRRGNDLHLYRILLTDHTGYQLNNAE
jgi:hypothetical protein